MLFSSMSRSGLIDPRLEVLDGLEHHRPPRCLSSLGCRRRRLDDRAVGREVAAKNGDAGVGLERLGEFPDDLAIPARRVGDVLAHGAAVGGERVLVQHRSDLAQHRGQPARVVEILHQVLARGLQVDEARQLRAELVPVLELELHADPAGDRQQVHHGIGRTADRGIRLDGVLERLAREDLREHQIFVHHLDDAPAGELRQAVTLRIDRGNRRVAR